MLAVFYVKNFMKSIIFVTYWQRWTSENSWNGWGNHANIQEFVATKWVKLIALKLNIIIKFHKHLPYDSLSLHSQPLRSWHVICQCTNQKTLSHFPPEIPQNSDYTSDAHPASFKHQSVHRKLEPRDVNWKWFSQIGKRHLYRDIKSERKFNNNKNILLSKKMSKHLVFDFCAVLPPDSCLRTDFKRFLIGRRDEVARRVEVFGACQTVGNDVMTVTLWCVKGHLR